MRGVACIHELRRLASIGREMVQFETTACYSAKSRTGCRLTRRGHHHDERPCGFELEPKALDAHSAPRGLAP